MTDGTESTDSTGGTDERSLDDRIAEALGPGGGFRTDVPDTYRAGFACLVGRPNTGKSTLTNALVGEKVAITSDKPQTTRHTVRGIVHADDHQLILVDTPGLHRPRKIGRASCRERV